MSVPESKVLKAINASNRDETEWPSINLNQAEVFDSKTGELASLLDADSKRPRTISGKIGALAKEHEKLCTVRRR